MRAAAGELQPLYSHFFGSPELPEEIWDGASIMAFLGMLGESDEMTIKGAEEERMRFLSELEAPTALCISRNTCKAPGGSLLVVML